MALVQKAPWLEFLQAITSSATQNDIRLLLVLYLVYECQHCAVNTHAREETICKFLMRSGSGM